MPFLRFTRDKRGYEQFALVHAMNRRGKSVSRVLYWFRTPPDLKVGREPFDEAVRRALEAQNPDIRFDWKQILETPIPSADAEKWRERRRAERSERAARQAAEREEIEANGADDQRPPDAPLHVLEVAAAAAETVVVSLSEVERVEPLDSRPAQAGPPEPASGERAGSVPGGRAGPRRKRRRRRGGHGRPADRPVADGNSAAPAVGAGEERAPDKDE
jgi:hypothetical protein